MNSWRAARTPLPTSVYSPPPPRRRVGVIALALFFALAAILVVSHHVERLPDDSQLTPRLGPFAAKYDATYPLTSPVRLPNGCMEYQLAMVADPDETSRVGKDATWISRLVTGKLVRCPTEGYQFHVGEHLQLVTNVAAKNRGAELSELIVFNGKIMTVDDRTGIVYEISRGQLLPRYILADGSGDQTKGLKGEWMAVKGSTLWVGGLGRDWTTSKFVNDNPKWIKVPSREHSWYLLFGQRISPNGAVIHLNWTRQYNALQKAAGLPSTGYLWHESAAWSDVFKRWFFMPRRVSTQPYDEKEDLTRGSNVLLSADDDFKLITKLDVGIISPTRGFSSFKFIPGTQDSEIIALKTEEDANGNFKSYIMAFETSTGRLLLQEQYISAEKLEGIEFI